jgi:hypothetical protein
MDSSCTAFVGACWDALAHTRDCEDPQAIRLGWRSSDAPAGDFIREPVDPSRWPHLLWRVDPGSVSSRIALACHIAVCHLYGKAETIAMLQERWGSVLELDPRPQGALFAFLRRTFVARTAKGRLGTFYHRGLADFVSVGSCYTMDSSCTAFVGACWDVFTAQQRQMLLQDAASGCRHRFLLQGSASHTKLYSQPGAGCRHRMPPQGE